jgi:hypothetical protein
MDRSTKQLQLLLAYKIIGLLIGLAVVYMGYNLFVKGVFGNAGSLFTKDGDKSLYLKEAAPGTFFALFGAVFMIFVVWKGVNTSENKSLYQNGLDSVDNRGEHGIQGQTDYKDKSIVQNTPGHEDKQISQNTLVYRSEDISEGKIDYQVPQKVRPRFKKIITSSSHVAVALRDRDKNNFRPFENV